MTADLFFSKEPLSSAPGGEAIAVGTTEVIVHTSQARRRNEFDEVWLWAANGSGSQVTATVDVGGLGVTFGTTLAPQGNLGSSPVLLVSGIPLHSGRSLRVTSGSASGLVVFGYVNRGSYGTS